MSNSPKKKKYKFKVGQTVYYIDDAWYRESFDDPDCDTLEWISPGTIDRAFTEYDSSLMATPHVYYNVRDSDSVLHYYYEERDLFSTPEAARAVLIERVAGDLKVLSKNLKSLKNIREDD